MNDLVLRLLYIVLGRGRIHVALTFSTVKEPRLAAEECLPTQIYYFWWLLESLLQV
jgi:hypothetical protein